MSHNLITYLNIKYMYILLIMNIINHTIPEENVTINNVDNVTNETQSTSSVTPNISTNIANTTTANTTTDNICMARMKSNLHIRCSKIKKTNSDFCGIHMRAKHVIRINEDIPKDYCPKIKNNIIAISGVPMEVINYNDLKQNKFNSKKFNYRHILYSLQQYKLPNLKNKQNNFESLQTYIINLYTKNKTYIENIDNINLIIKTYKNYLLTKINKARGIGFFKRSLINNKTDFLDFTNINDISDTQLITYKDESKFIYGFSVSSLLSYIEELDTTHINNPYTQKPFSKKFIDNIYIVDKHNKHFKQTLQNTTQDTNQHEHIKHNLTPELKVKRLCVSIFQRMDELELYTQASWFLDLNILNLKKLYFLIEDIWNYRARLTRVLKKKFVTNGIAFNWPIFYIKKITNKVKIQTILLQEFEKFVYQGATKSDCVTASYWILMGLTAVSPAAAAGCPSLVQSNY